MHSLCFKMADWFDRSNSTDNLGTSMTKKSGRSVRFNLPDLHMNLSVSKKGVQYSHTVISVELVVAKLL